MKTNKKSLEAAYPIPDNLKDYPIKAFIYGVIRHTCSQNNVNFLYLKDLYGGKLDLNDIVERSSKQLETHRYLALYFDPTDYKLSIDQANNRDELIKLYWNFPCIKDFLNIHELYLHQKKYKIEVFVDRV